MNYFVEIMDDLYMVDLCTFQVFMSREVTSHWASFRIWIPPQLGLTDPQAEGGCSSAFLDHWER